MTNPRRVADEPYTLFVNQTKYGNARFLRTNVLLARPPPADLPVPLRHQWHGGCRAERRAVSA